MLASVRLLRNFPITDYKNVCLWSSNDARNSAIDAWDGRNISNVSTIDISKNIFRCQLEYTESLDYNYMYFTQNGRRFYCFIRDIEWVSNTTMSFIHFEIDYFTTFQHDITFKKCLVVREHVKNDTFGLHLIDEGFPVGDVKTVDYRLIDFTNYMVAVCLSDTSLLYPAGGDGAPTQDDIGAIHRINVNNFIPCTILTNNEHQLTKVINILNRHGKKDSILCVYMQPRATALETQGCMLGVLSDDHQSFVDAVSTSMIKQTVQTLPHIDNTFSKPTTVDGYKPHNKKCFLYPYNYLEVSNQNGNSMIGKYEYGNGDNEIELSCYCPVGSNNNSYAYFKNYNGIPKNLDYCIVGGLNPQIPYNTNVYSNYFSSNYNAIANNFRNYSNDVLISGASAVNSVASNGLGNLGAKNFNFASSVASTGTSAISGATSIYNAYNQAKNFEASLKDIRNRPNQTTGSFTGTSTLLELEWGFKVKKMQIPKDYIEQIDNYFSMYGYKVNVCKVPDLNARTIFNYIQTDGCNIVGSCPQIAINTIKDAFNNGVTVWHGLGNMFNYDFDGNEV